MPKWTFTGHETFPLRGVWLKKAVDAVQEMPDIFSRDDAIAHFGVGKNMVRSIKHWARVTGVLQNAENNTLEPTRLGTVLLGEDGFDPYLEDPSTLWLLHWQLCQSPAGLWQFIFGSWRGDAMYFQELLREIQPWLLGQGEPMPSSGTLKRDFQVFQATYLPPRVNSKDVEDVLSYPLTSMGLLAIEDGQIYLRRRVSDQLSPEMFAYFLADFFSKQEGNPTTISIEQLLNGRSGPGKCLLLDEDRFFELIEAVEELEGSPFRYSDSAGVRQLIRTAEVDPFELLQTHYGTFA